MTIPYQILKFKEFNGNFTHIFHIADIHIQLTKRHDEYAEVFENLYRCVEVTDKNTIVCIVGDLFHNKSDLSPECVQLATTFLKRLADIRPVILTAGNHDATLANKSRLDSLSPVVSAIKHDNLLYLKDNGLYGIGNILFNNMSVFDDIENYIMGEKIPDIYKNKYSHVIALYHGPVYQAQTDMGYNISNKMMPVEKFDGHHIALLGDIHKAQTLQDYDDENKKPIVRYCGSLVQRDHGESLKNHGFSYWTLADRKFVHCDIPNKYGYYTIEIVNGKLITDLTDIPVKSRLRVKCFETVATEVKAVLADVRTKTEIVELAYLPTTDNPTDVDIQKRQTNDYVLGNIFDITYQNKLITEHLKDVANISDTNIIDAVIKINEQVNTKTKRDSISKNIQWLPKRFEFDNMFLYGEGNVVDFSKLQDMTGLFAPNRSGKTSLLSALSFCIFDKFDRGYKANTVLNFKKMGFWCKFNFEINGVDFFIEKKGTADKKRNVKVDIDFWKIENGNKVSLNGVDRRETNDNIREYFGEYEEFTLTCLSTQVAKYNSSFIDMGNTERKDLLCKFIGLHIFDSLFQTASEKYKELTTILKMYTNDDYTHQLNTIVNNKQSHEIVVSSEQRCLNELLVSHEQLQSQLIEENRNIKPIEGNFTGKNISDDQIKFEKSHSFITKYETELAENQLIATELQHQQTAINTKLVDIEMTGFKDVYTRYSAASNELKELHATIERKKIEVNGKLDKLNKLKLHKYDPNCQFCVDNIFVKDAIDTQAQLEKDRVICESMMEKHASVQATINETQWADVKHKEFESLTKENIQLQTRLSTINTKINKIHIDISKTKFERDKLEKEIELYKKFESDIIYNREVQEKIDSLSKQIKAISIDIKNKNKAVEELNGKILLCTKSINELSDKIAKVKLVEEEYKYYDLYVKSIGRDGIPYNIISRTVPVLEAEINCILEQVTSFTIKLESDEKNIVPYICDDNGQRPIELASGVERFILSLAIRISLIKISNLPRSNFLCIDEGFGCADSNNLAEINGLLGYLKSQFNFILIISHLDTMKDIPDHFLEIKQENGFSHIKFE